MSHKTIDAVHPRAVQAPHRRQFVTQMGSIAAAVVAGALTTPSDASAQSSRPCVAPAMPSGVTNSRMAEAFNLRVEEAAQNASISAAVNVNNGDDALYPDKGGTYTKGLPHDSFGRVDLNAYATFKTALASGRFADFEKIIMGGTRTLNGPQGGLAFDLCRMDNVQFGQPTVPPAPPIDGDQTGAELVELYWASLLRDVAFTDYDSNALAALAASELSGLPAYRGPRSAGGQVTTDLLFRGIFPGETLGPYVSQFLITPTNLGAQPISQQMVSYLPNVDYMANFSDWLLVQNGNVAGLQNAIDPVLRYRRLGRDLAAFTHVDVLYQAHFTAFLVLSSIGAPFNPGNPYNQSKCENGFGTFGPPDFASTLAEVATKALNAVWYQKWFVHLRPRPEATGGQVHLVKTGQGSDTDVQPSQVVLNSMGLQQSFTKFGTYLLAQAFPEGSPVHPAYPTGHGTVGGASLTVLKFFFDGNFVIPNPLVPSSDGSSLAAYEGSDAGQLTVNGELNKLGHNITFGHGIHAGIHWRSDSDTSLLLGEAVALSFL
ncbi:vanadium-dependent haloperoxidase, partial [Nevskia soli]|uniref:vanadium-dependent haloperoxidase n=1 Tax=Nevskia soli TaxID=418856 RepID=UPI0015D89252